MEFKYEVAFNISEEQQKELMETYNVDKDKVSAILEKQLIKVICSEFYEVEIEVEEIK